MFVGLESLDYVTLHGQYSKALVLKCKTNQNQAKPTKTTKPTKTDQNQPKATKTRHELGLKNIET